MIHQSPSEEEAKSYFQKLVASAKNEAKGFSLDDPETKRIIQGYIDATKRNQGQSVGFTGVTILGSIVDTDEAYEVSMIVAGKAQTEQGEIAIPMTAALAWIRRGKQILEMSDLAQFTGKDSVALADRTVTNWVNDLVRLRPAP